VDINVSNTNATSLFKVEMIEVKEVVCHIEMGAKENM